MGANVATAAPLEKISLTKGTSYDRRHLLNRGVCRTGRLDITGPIREANLVQAFGQDVLQEAAHLSTASSPSPQGRILTIQRILQALAGMIRSGRFCANQALSLPRTSLAMAVSGARKEGRAGCQWVPSSETPPPRDDAVNVGLIVELRRPGVQDREDADGAAMAACASPLMPAWRPISSARWAIAI
jgi:hypothetical protein